MGVSKSRQEIYDLLQNDGNTNTNSDDIALEDMTDAVESMLTQANKLSADYNITEKQLSLILSTVLKLSTTDDRLYSSIEQDKNALEHNVAATS